jgi:hypothetical protein
LKDQNRLGLSIVIIANAVALYALAAVDSFAYTDWVEAGKLLGKIIPASLGVVVVSIFNAQLDPTAKARIVFLRWKYPLPGARAFTKYGPNDMRVDMDALRTRLGELPAEPAKQNSIWYGLYREVADKPAILHANKEYLFARDYHVISLGMLIVFGVASLWAIAEPVTRAWYLGGLLLQVFLTGQAARNHGCQLVCNVLALSAAVKVPSEKAGKKKK